MAAPAYARKNIASYINWVVESGKDGDYISSAQLDSLRATSQHVAKFYPYLLLPRVRFSFRDLHVSWVARGREEQEYFCFEFFRDGSLFMHDGVHVMNINDVEIISAIRVPRMTQAEENVIKNALDAYSNMPLCRQYINYCGFDKDGAYRASLEPFDRAELSVDAV